MLLQQINGILIAPYVNEKTGFESLQELEPIA